MDFVGRRTGGGWEVTTIKKHTHQQRKALEERRERTRKEHEANEARMREDDPASQMLMQSIGSRPSTILQLAQSQSTTFDFVSEQSIRSPKTTTRGGGQRMDTNRHRSVANLYASRRGKHPALSDGGVRSPLSPGSGGASGFMSKSRGQLLTPEEQVAAEEQSRLEALRVKYNFPVMYKPCGEEIRSELRDTLTRHFANRAHLLSPDSRDILQKLGVQTDLSKISSKSSSHAVRIIDVRFTTIDNSDLKLTQVVHNVCHHMSLASKHRQELEQFFLTPGGEEMIRIMFWFVYCAFFQHHSLREIETHLPKISKVYCQHVMKMSRQSLDVFTFVVSHMICLMFFVTFPGSNTLFTLAFVDRIYLLVGTMLGGMEYTRRFCDFMRTKYFSHESLKLPVSLGVHTDPKNANGSKNAGLSSSQVTTPPLPIPPELQQPTLTNHSTDEDMVSILHDKDFHIFNSAILDYEYATEVLRKRDAEKAAPALKAKDKLEIIERKKSHLPTFVPDNNPSGGYPTNVALPGQLSDVSYDTEVMFFLCSNTHRDVSLYGPAGSALRHGIANKVGDSGVAGILEFARAHQSESFRKLVQSPRADPYSVEMARRFAVMEGAKDQLEPRRAVTASLEVPTVFNLSEYKTKPSPYSKGPPQVLGKRNKKPDSSPLALPSPSLSSIDGTQDYMSSKGPTPIPDRTPQPDHLIVADVLQLRGPRGVEGGENVDPEESQPNASVPDDVVAAVRLLRKSPEDTSLTSENVRPLSLPPPPPRTPYGNPSGLQLMARVQIHKESSLHRMRQKPNGTVETKLTVTQPLNLVRVAVTSRESTTAPRVVTTTVGYEPPTLYYDEAQEIRRATTSLSQQHRSDTEHHHDAIRHHRMKCKNEFNLMTLQRDECMNSPREIEKLVSTIMSTPSQSQNQSVASYMNRKGMTHNSFKGTILAEHALSLAHDVDKSLRKLEKMCKNPLGRKGGRSV
eukprot:PhF_6_TR40232/c0_g1_i1/m.59808